MKKKKLLIKNIIFFSFAFLLNYFYNYTNNLNHIHISMSMTNNYTYPIMVSITSILINSKNTTFINFHILIGKDIEKENKEKIKSLKKINKNSRFKFYNVGINFKGWIHGRKRTVASFYRIILGKIIKNTNKIIYLDGDTITFGDLYEMYTLNMKNLYFRGVGEPHWINTKKRRFICAGVMLINLEIIRKDNVYEKCRRFYLDNFNKGIYYGDQYIINYLFNNKIGFLPPKFGMWFINNKFIHKYLKLNHIIYKKKELIQSHKNPIIRPIWGVNEKGQFYEKPWLSKKNNKIKIIWNYYAKKTGYYYSICNFFKKACILKKNH